MNNAPLINRVAQSALRTFDLEDLWPNGGIKRISLLALTTEGLIREAHMREYVRNLKMNTYDASVVCLEGANEVIVPKWLGPMLASALAPHAAFVGFGTQDEVLSAYYAQALAALDWTDYRGAKVLIKGCGTHPVPDTAYAVAALHLTRVAEKLMYGEACSNVPIFKASGS